MLDPRQFTKHIIRPALKAIDLHSVAAEELLLGTAIQESRLTYLVQIGGGPALGVFQMEPATHDDIQGNYLAYRQDLTDKVAASCGVYKSREMVWNLKYAAVMCRIHYYRVPAALPEAGNVSRQAEYWKKHYNTVAGAGTEQEYMANWHKYSRTDGVS